ncbi:MAG: hypothetical protein LUQ04_00925 [Methanoregula sp.]|nr:hypothetical protein [Methanoregula sp.]
MKKITPLSLLIIIGCILGMLAAVYFIQSLKTTGQENSTTPVITPSSTLTNLGTWQPIAPADPGTGSGMSGSGIKGLLIVSIGEYNAKMPVLVDNANVGEVSKGTPLNISVKEGYHVVMVCSGDMCEQLGVEVKSGIKTTIDFGERLIKDAPLGSLNVSIGDYDARLPVYLDNTSVGEVSGGKPLILTISEGSHSVRVCSGNVCEQQDVEINVTRPVSVDFWERLQKYLPKGPLTVSIGGYNAELPVFIDDTRVGMVSMGRPLILMVIEGRHTVKVCVGIICESEIVDIRFAQPFVIDFGERLKKSAEFPTPTVRIVNSFLTGNSLTVDVEFINPDTIDHTMTATIGCGYSYNDPTSRERHNKYAQSPVTKSVKAGNRLTEGVTISLTGGYAVIANEPTVIDVVIT